MKSGRRSLLAPLSLPALPALPALLALLALLLLAGGCGDDDGAIPDAGQQATCGNGVVEPGEGCDDGNQDDSDGCCSSCQPCLVCTTDVGATCDASSICCPTDQDQSTDCAAAGYLNGPSLCLLPCGSGPDCDWSNRCDADFPGHCSTAWCGPEDDGAALNGPCDVNGETGWCYPTFTAEAGYGLCVEPGILPPGAPCVAGYSLNAIPRDVETCDGGVCAHWRSDRAPICLAFCDPVAAYDATGLGADGCPEGTNCLSFSSLSSYSGKRLPDKGRCIPTPAADPDGLLACDLLNGQLIHDRAARCGDLLPDTRCGLLYRGSLMGTCQTADASPLSLGAPCSRDATALPCATGATCTFADPFGAADPDVAACLALCDAGDPAWACATAGFVCTSLSHGVEDASPTRLGLCAPPPPAP